MCFFSLTAENMYIYLPVHYVVMCVKEFDVTFNRNGTEIEQVMSKNRIIMFVTPLGGIRGGRGAPGP